jgi:hypothetical protein
VLTEGTHSSGFFLKKMPPCTPVKKVYVHSENALHWGTHFPWGLQVAHALVAAVDSMADAGSFAAA